VAQEEQIHQTSSFPVQTAQAIDVLAFGPLNQHIFDYFLFSFTNPVRAILVADDFRVESTAGRA
jgi:hypothetical protein